MLINGNSYCGVGMKEALNKINVSSSWPDAQNIYYFLLTELAKMTVP
jgi:hypothetical protein